MPIAMARKWWILMLNGLCAIAFGVMAFVWPGLGLLTLIILFGVYCIADGITAVGASLARSGDGRSWALMLVAGLISIAAGTVAFARPGLTAYALLILIAVWAMLRGVFEIVAAIELRKLIRNEWFLILAGAVSILFGAVLIARPGAGALAVIWLIGAAAIARGVLLEILSLRLRGELHGAQTA